MLELVLQFQSWEDLHNSFLVSSNMSRKIIGHELAIIRLTSCIMISVQPSDYVQLVEA